MASNISFKKDCLPFVSLIIPMKNEEAYITNCLESFVNQSYPRDHYEILIVDDHSIDNSTKKVEALIDRYPETRITLLTSDRVGVSNAYRTGIGLAKGVIILRATAHLIAEKNTMLELVTKLSDLHSEYVGTTCPLVVYPKDKTFSRATVALLASSLGGYGTSHYSPKQSGPTREGKTIMALRADIFGLIGGYPEGDDPELNALIQKAGYKFWLVKETHAFYRYKHFGLVRHFKRMFSYGESRAREFRKHKSSKKLVYIIPSILTLSILFLFASLFFNNWLIRLIAGSLIVSYLIIVLHYLFLFL